MRRLPVVTTSQVKCFQRCQRLHWFQYILGYRPVERAHALDFGTLVHVGLEAWWASAGDLDKALRVLAEAHSKADGLSEYDLARASVMLEGYHARWAEEPITVLSVEHEFRVPIRLDGNEHHIELVGKFDAICEIGGRVYIPEHKSKSEKVDALAYFEALRSDMQVSNYLIAASELGHRPGGALYDVLVKPGEPRLATPVESRKYTKEGKLYARQRDGDEGIDEYRARLFEMLAERPEDFYQRATVVRFDEEIDAARADLWHIADAIWASYSRSFHPRSPGACRDYARPCEFAPVCWEGASLEDSTRYRKLDNPHEELSHATSKTAAE
jgi:PD-(D/E)XK nuclease superfamily